MLSSSKWKYNYQLHRKKWNLNSFSSFNATSTQYIFCTSRQEWSCTQKSSTPKVSQLQGFFFVCGLQWFWNIFNDNIHVVQGSHRVLQCLFDIIFQTHLTDLIAWKTSSIFSTIRGLRLSNRWIASRTNSKTSAAAASLLSLRNSISYHKRVNISTNSSTVKFVQQHFPLTFRKIKVHIYHPLNKTEVKQP